VIHACFAQIVFWRSAGIAVFTSKWWVTEQPQLEDSGSPSIHSLTILNAAVIYIQVILGAGFRHKGHSDLAAHGWSDAGARDGGLDGGRTAQTVLRKSRELSKARIMLHAIFGTQFLLGLAAYWSRLTTTDAPQADAGHGDVNGDPYGGLARYCCLFGAGGAGVLPVGSAEKGSCFDGARPGDHLMSAARSTELTLSARANGYVSLTKPDVSFLVLMTTAAGYYMGARAAPLAGCTWSMW